MGSPGRRQFLPGPLSFPFPTSHSLANAMVRMGQKGFNPAKNATIAIGIIPRVPFTDRVRYPFQLRRLPLTGHYRTRLKFEKKYPLIVGTNLACSVCIAEMRYMSTNVMESRTASGCGVNQFLKCWYSALSSDVATRHVRGGITSLLLTIGTPSTSTSKCIAL